ncbi:Acetyl-coenzyme A synthetase, cytoplasmic [Blomia tropicalis]|nr:Acetyl-coenzyme A synthetase, cytoplasmic [Blomia tropicalis]
MAISEQTEDQLVYPNDEYRKDALINSLEEYRRLYKLSVEDPANFWFNMCSNFYWKKGPILSSMIEYNFDISKGPIYVKWMKDAITNICYNVLDRHIDAGLGDRIAYYWEGNELHESRSITYSALLKEVCKFANFLTNKGLKKGDRIAIYMPVTIDLVIAMLGAARIGVIHTVVFAGFSAQSLSERIIDAKCSIVVTMDGSLRGKKVIALKEIADSAIEICRNKNHPIKCCIVQRHLNATGTDVSNSDINNNVQVKWNSQIDIWWNVALKNMPDYCDPIWMDAEDPLFIFGSTGKPKGVLHTVAGYMVYAATTFKYVFNYQSDDVFFCTADLGWITGHTVNVYGALANAATIVLFEGTPFYPHPGRLWEIVDKLHVSTFYTAPTAIRSLMKYSDDIVRKYRLDSLRLLGTAGEPINPEAWCWYYRMVGKRRCPIVDTFWQTETEIDGSGSGILAFKKPWPSIARTIDGNHERYEMTYFHKFKGYFCTGDGCFRDRDGYYWITGRSDDMLNVSGHLLSTAQVESAIVEHKAVAEAAPSLVHIRSRANNGFNYSNEIEKDIKERARDKIGALAVPEVIHPISALPKTRSGKIMRRILAKVTRDDTDLGDISTMADESILEELFATKHIYAAF